MAGNGPGKIFWIILIVFILLSWYFYKEPQKAHDFVNPLYGKIDSWLIQTFHFGGSNTNINQTAADTAESSCPSVEDKVCGNGITYQNICYATYAGVMKVTAGAC